ncbi:MAG TPA: hypothetical protein VNK82_03045 [Terriglobales bacterium]|nr:hypothetical protein [Terriglobales bacterium]
MEADALRPTPSTLPVDPGAETGLNWSPWSRCESSFSLLLVPHQPGVFALAEEVAAPAGAAARRMLALFHVAEAEDLARALSRLFAAESPVRAKLQEGRCYVRYAAIADPGRRRAVAAALAHWLAAASDSAAALSSDASGDPFGGSALPPPSIVNPKIVNRHSKDLRPSPLPAGF